MSQHEVPTVRVQREKSQDNPSGIVVINESDLTADDVVVKENATPSATAVPVVPATPATPPAEETEEKVKQPWEK